MRRKNHTHQQDIDDLKKQNALLEQQGERTNLSVFLSLCWNMQRVTSCGVFLSRLELQSEHWRKPRATLSSRQTTLLTAACTQTAKGAPCPPSTAALTPAPNRSQTSRPTERSCARSPVRLAWPPRLSKQTLFTHQPQLLLPVRAQSCLLTPVQEMRWRLCERGAIMYKTLLPFFFHLASILSLLFWPPKTTFKTHKVRQLCSFEGLIFFEPHYNHS